MGWEMNLSPLEDQQELLTGESHLSSPMLSIHFKPFTKLLCIVSLWLATVLKQKLQLGKYMYKFSTTQIYCKQNYCKQSCVTSGHFRCHSAGTLLTLLMTVFSQAWSTPRDPQWPGLQAVFPQVPFSLGSGTYPRLERQVRY